MRFTQGYWVIRQDYVMSYATQTVRVIKNDKELHIISACRPIRHRGDILGGSLDIVFTAPRKNIIRVQVTHFAGTPRKDPQFTTYEEDVTPEIREDDDYAYFTSGELTARVSKGGNWAVDYMVGDRILTTSGWRGMGRALKKDGTPCSLLPHGTSYMSESLQLDVGECVYGLGERFGAYVKNGQTVDMWNADGGTASELAYKNIPFYMTNRGYGVLVENASDVSFEVWRHAQGHTRPVHRADGASGTGARVVVRPVAVHVLHHELRRADDVLLHQRHGGARHSAVRVPL